MDILTYYGHIKESKYDFSMIVSLQVLELRFLKLK